jgi:A/G-specific adenine glycosylase
MLQQTTVEAVAPYFRRWMRRFPSLRELCSASDLDVLRVWEGLGYYARARNIRRAAQLIKQKHGGRIPRDLAALERLPGVGAYTAAAIASIAFGYDVVALDGNVRRVLARLAAIRGTRPRAASEKRLLEIGKVYLPLGRASEFNQALMDLGATMCTPRAPHCESCPLRRLCKACSLGLQETIPARQIKKQAPSYRSAAAVFSNSGKVLLIRRSPGGLLGGMWEFPKSHRASRLPTRRGLAAHFLAVLPGARAIHVQSTRPFVVVPHAYSHFRLTVSAFACTMKGQASKIDSFWVPIASLADYPMGKIDRVIAEHVQAATPFDGLPANRR